VKTKPVAWRVTSEGQSYIYDIKSEAMFWGDFKAVYSTTPIKRPAEPAGIAIM
jgi:hypothetical protein